MKVFISLITMSIQLTALEMRKTKEFPQFLQQEKNRDKVC